MTDTNGKALLRACTWTMLAHGPEKVQDPMLQGMCECIR